MRHMQAEVIPGVPAGDAVGLSDGVADAAAIARLREELRDEFRRRTADPGADVGRRGAQSAGADVRGASPISWRRWWRGEPN
jgi:hypothetical protein